MKHQKKSWIKTTYSWVRESNIDRYFNKFNFRLNRSQNKATIFNNLIVKTVKADKIYQTEVISNKLLTSKNIVILFMTREKR